MAKASAPTGAEVIADAKRYLGVKYVFGGGPQNPMAGLDCSGLTSRVALDLGIKGFPRTSEEQWAAVGHVSVPNPGDLVFFVGAPEEAGPPGHVGIVVTPGTMVDAPHTGTVVSIQNYSEQGSGENKVMGYGQFPGVQSSPTGKITPGTGFEKAGAEAAAGAASIIGMIMLVLMVAVIVLAIVVVVIMLHG